ncbi:hypothetical protein LEMLEM_LOCUS9725 [Lemmus lemmus]
MPMFVDALASHQDCRASTHSVPSSPPLFIHQDCRASTHSVPSSPHSSSTRTAEPPHTLFHLPPTLHPPGLQSLHTLCFIFPPTLHPPRSAVYNVLCLNFPVSAYPFLLCGLQDGSVGKAVYCTTLTTWV